MIMFDFLYFPKIVLKKLLHTGTTRFSSGLVQILLISVRSPAPDVQILSSDRSPDVQILSSARSPVSGCPDSDSARSPNSATSISDDVALYVNFCIYGRNLPLLTKIFPNRGFGPFRVRTPDFDQKSGVLPLETAKIPDFFRACGAF